MIGVNIINDNNLIGGSTPAARNLLSGQFDGFGVVRNAVANFTTVQGNTIGLDRPGTQVLQKEEGFGIRSFLNDGLSILKNVIAGNNILNIAILENSDNVLIQNNIIGADVSGTQAILPNGIGIIIVDAFTFRTLNISVDSNQISGNTYGIFNGDNDTLNFPPNGVTITNNIIGLDSSGTKPLPNTLDGIWINYAQNSYIDGNVISANGRHGIRTGKGKGTIIQGNVIGSDAAGTLHLGNQGDGIRLGTSGVGLQSFADVIGGSLAGLGNFIAFNHGNGIKTQSYVKHETIIGNIITNNGKNGILIGPFASEINLGIFQSVGDLRLAGDTASQGDTNLGPLGTSNIISGNGCQGIKILKADDNLVQTNQIEGNDHSGVLIDQSSHNQIGGKMVISPCIGNPPVLGNSITNNTGFGVEVTGKGNSAVDNAISANSIAQNLREGIELKKKNHKK
jgi:parallel beta-helix repeat protein